MHVVKESRDTEVKRGTPERRREHLISSEEQQPSTFGQSTLDRTIGSSIESPSTKNQERGNIIEQECDAQLGSCSSIKWRSKLEVSNVIGTNPRT